MEDTAPGSGQERKLTVSFENICELCNCSVIIWKAEAAATAWQGNPKSPQADFPAPGRGEGSLGVLPSLFAPHGG